jgi:hypothetical protein
MSHLYYDHLIVMKDLEIHISKLEISSDEKQKIYKMVDETIHYRITTRVLNELPREHHEHYLELFTRYPYHPKVMEFLKEQIVDIEDKITQEVKDLEKLFLSDLDEARKRNPSEAKLGLAKGETKK